MLFKFLTWLYTAGDNFNTARQKIEHLLEKGFSITSDLLGEFGSDPEKIKSLVEQYVAHIEVLGSIKRAHLNKAVTLAIKPSQIGLGLSPLYFQKNLMQILTAARNEGIFIWVDAEKKEDREAVSSIVIRMNSFFHGFVGLALQSVHSDAMQFLAKLLEKNVPVRLVKGAYTDGDLTDINDINLNYRKLFWEALYHYKNSPEKSIVAVATHDERLINYALAYRRDEEVGHIIQVQMLYNIRKKLQMELVGQQYNVLVYVPWGSDRIGFLKRRLEEMKKGMLKSNRWLFVRNIFEAWRYN